MRNGLGNRLTVRYLGRTLIDFKVELPTETIHNNLQVEFTHPADYRLPRLGIGLRAECWVFLRELTQRNT